MTVEAAPPLPRIEADRHQFAFDAGATPALKVDPGARVVIETLDCFSNRLDADAPALRRDRDVLDHIGGRYNPVSAPIFVRGAQPGDSLVVDILDIALGRRQGFAVTHVAHDWAAGFAGAGFADRVAPATVVAPLNAGTIGLVFGGRTVSAPVRPMIGTIGTAPAGAPIGSLLYGPTHGGNLDCPRVRAGASVVLPVNVPGGLLSLGDVHALMGEGELTGTAFETSADVTVRLRLVKGGEPPAAPRILDSGGIGVLGCVSRTSLEDNIRAAARDLVTLAARDFRLSLAEALQLVSMFARITVNQAVGNSRQRWLSALVWLPWDELDRLMPERPARGAPMHAA